MKNIFLFILCIIGLFSVGCNDDEEVTDMFEYHAHIYSPNNAAKHLKDTIQIRVNFESHTGETVHHVKVRIYNKVTNAEVFNEPNDAHVHATSGEFEFSQELVLSQENGFMEHSDWILEAKVWGDGPGVSEAMEEIEFHVHPEM